MEILELVVIFSMISAVFLGITLWPAYLLTTLFNKKPELPNVLVLMFVTTAILVLTATILSSFFIVVNKNDFIKSYVIAIGLIAGFFSALLISKFVQKWQLKTSAKIFLGIWYSLTCLLFLYFDYVSKNAGIGFNEGFGLIFGAILMAAIASVVTLYIHVKSEK